MLVRGNDKMAEMDCSRIAARTGAEVEESGERNAPSW